MSDGDLSVPSRAVPLPVWALLVGAIVQLGVQVAPDSYQVFGPYFLVDGSMLVGWLQSITPFLLAAAVVLGADRWPAGRRALLLAAAALAVVGVLRLASDAWWAIWEISPGAIPDGIQPWLTGSFLGAALGTFLAYASIAGGLAAVPPDRPVGGVRVVLVTLIALAGLVAAGAGLWTVAITFDYAGSDEHLWISVVGTVLVTAGFAALAAVAIAAVRASRREQRLPEVLIAMGAFVTMIATAWTWCFPYFATEVAWAEHMIVWVFTIPGALAVLGMGAMIAGFGAAALAGRRHATADPSA
jgi:hypothetical protein